MAGPNVKPWRRHLRVTREGKWFILVTLGVGVAAFNTGNNLLYLVLGFMLSLIVLSGILSELVLRRVRVQRRLPGRWFAQATRPVELVVHNDKARTPSLSLQVEELAEGTAAPSCYVLKVAPKSMQAASYRLTPTRRGPLRFIGLRVATRYPFGIFEKRRFVELRDEALIYPALLPGSCRSEAAHRAGAQVPLGTVGSGQELAGLRAYRAEDEARAIHWKRSAALGEIVVREREQEAARQVILSVNNLRPAGASDTWSEGFERTISEVAGLAVALLRRGTAVQIAAASTCSAVVLPGAAPDPLFRFLALLQPECASRPEQQPEPAPPDAAEQLAQAGLGR